MTGTIDLTLDGEGLWSSAPVPGAEPVARAVATASGMRAGRQWPLAVDGGLPAALAVLLQSARDDGSPPGERLLAASRLCLAGAAVASGPLVPVPDPGSGAGGWLWRATPTGQAATEWERALDAAADAFVPGRLAGVPELVARLADGVVAALAGPVTGGPGDVPPRWTARREAQWRAWADLVAARRAAGVRLALRLDAPVAPPEQEEQDPWWLVPLVVSLAEDTTRRPLAGATAQAAGCTERAWQAWRATEAGALAQALADLPPDVAAMLTDPGADPVSLEVAEVLDLLDRALPALAAAGIDLVAHSGLLRRAGVRRRARSTSGTSSGLAAGDLGLQVGVSVDGEELTREEVEALAAAKSELVVVRGRWTRVDDGERARLARLLQRTTGPVRVADLLADEAFEGVEVDPPERLQVARRVEPPVGLLATLRHYQRDGLDWLTWLEENGTGGVLADDMGLGKTMQVLARVLADRSVDGSGPTLVVCPLTLVDTWARQAAQFAPGLVVGVHHGAGREDVADLAARCDLVLTTYGLLARDEDLRAQPWHRVVLDEAQAVKNPDTRTARAARALTATHRLAVTGTPVENHLGELWSVLAFAAPGILPRRKEFERVYVRGAADENALTRLRLAVAPFVLRRTKTDPGIAPELPERTAIRVDCALTREQVGAYEAAAAAMLQEVETAGAGVRRLNVLAGIARLKQILVHPALLSERRTGLAGRSGKVDRLAELLGEVTDEGQAAVVFTQFASFVPALAAHLENVLGRPVLTLTGADDRSRRAEVVRTFSMQDGPPVLLASLKAGGTGLTLVRANHVVHLDRWWNPAVEDQASDRVWRIGQQRGVFVHTLVCPGTLEDRIDAMLTGKRAVASSVVRSTDTRVTELTDAQLADLVTLVRDRVLG